MNAEWNLIGVQLHGSYIERQMSRTNRNLLLLSAAFLLAVAAYAGFNWRYFYNFFKGPMQMDAGALQTVTAPDALPRYFVSLKGDDSIDTGLQTVEQETSESGSVESETVKSGYSILVLGKRLLIVERKPTDNGKSYQGALVDLPAGVRSQVVEPLLSDYPNIDAAFLPVMLDATGFRSRGYIALAICIPVLMLALWMIRKVVDRTNDPMLHPIVKSLVRYGQVPDRAREIEAEVGANGLGKTIFGQNWILLPDSLSLGMCRIPDLVWAYKKVTKRSVNFIPMGKRYSVVAYDRCGKPLEIQMKQEKADEILQTLATKAPWAIFGFSEDLKRASSKNWGEFVAAVDAKRAEPAH